MKGVLTIPNILYAGHDENFKFILNIFLKNNNFDLSLTNRYESLKSNLNNYDYSVVIIEDTLIKGNNRLFYNDFKNYKKKVAFLIISSGIYESEIILKYNDIGIEIIKKPFQLKDLLNKIEYLNEKDNIESSSINIKIPFIDKTNKTKGIFDSIYKIINNNLNALISGEIGTGKKQIANTINALREPNKKLLEIN